MKTFNSNGQSLVELLLAVALAAIILPALITGFVASREGKAQERQRIEAVTLMKEAQEATRNVREKDWTTFAVNGTFHPALSGSSWTLASGSESINGFTRSVLISDVYRDTQGQIVTSGGTLDPSTKKVVTTVLWSTPFPASVDTTAYIARLDNISYTETTEADFNRGTKTGTAITNTNGGEVTLGAGGQGSWCNPGTPSATLDLPKNGVSNAISAIEGKIYAATGENASGVSFAEVSVSNNNPPQLAIESTFDGYKTNDIFGDGHYVYLATDTNSEELVIIDVSQNPPVKVGSANVDGTAPAASVYVSGNIAYVVANTNRLYAFDISNKSSPVELDPDGIHLTATGYKVVVVGSYAYVATGNSTRDMVVIDVSNPSNLKFVGGTITNAAVARDLAVNSTGTRVYLATDSSATYEQNEFFIIDTSEKDDDDDPFPVIGAYNTGFLDLKGVTVVPGNVAIIVGKEFGSNEVDEYQVLNISNESTPVLCGSTNIEASVREVTSILEADGDAWSYILVGDDPELKAIAGGPGGQYASEGTFESGTFDAYPIQQTAFNRLSVNFNKPSSQTDIKFQLGIADALNTTSTGCSGVTFIYVGPSGTNADFFLTSSIPSGTGSLNYVIPLNDDALGYENPGRCFRYKAFLNTNDFNQTPILYDMSVNYSP